MKKLFVAVIVSTVTGCGAAAYAGHYADLTVGHVGCPRSEMVASDWDSDALSGKQTWRVRCRGHEFFCTTGGEGLTSDTPEVTTCTEAAAMLPMVGQ